ncbi:MAG: futalosine hydrolase [Meiothermus sp.]|uniref:futalosine hydrolase n=1 Tax=Meiothermus sp. TaxID=1955249 RepID=UPI0025D3B17C|nr:futalosine hydrolase [Meiothermus sp.]MCS7057612.1 futalosine hydrolase [Meiothermus sp.]MCS7193964.1 futalosine hydrolase [Meiothermus sp.]MCX7740319.1 futalosine hydrolase [Meiothermus sp.]MDW8090750.1 futalosine hydrolase [Meiothermus sp.]MDW8480824.1 futalosine hydrolase [Meiothermus sp.]
MMLLLSPTRFEAAFLRGRRFTFHGRAGLRGEGWVWLESGVGKVNTAATLAAFARGRKLERVLLFGIAGAYPGAGLQLGEAALAGEEVQADLGIRDRGMEGLGFPTLALGSGLYHNRFPLDRAFTAELSRTLGLPVRTFLTRDLVSESPSEARRLQRRWKADLENMEGAAFAQTCLWLGLRGGELRAVSNLAGVREKARWRIRQAVESLEHHILRIIGS